MIRLGIVGSNYGRTVQLPAFRADSRCEVVALAGSNAARTAELARADNIPKAYGDWRALVEDSNVQAVAIATLPSLQAQSSNRPAVSDTADKAVCVTRARSMRPRRRVVVHRSGIASSVALAGQPAAAAVVSRIVVNQALPDSLPHPFKKAFHKRRAAAAVRKYPRQRNRNGEPTNGFNVVSVRVTRLFCGISRLHEYSSDYPRWTFPRENIFMSSLNFFWSVIPASQRGAITAVHAASPKA